jgi:methyl-accepting chemotaxis protein
MSAVSAVRARLPRGNALPPETWRSRHRGITALLWLHVLGLLAIGLARGMDAWSVVPSVAVVALLAVGADVPRLGRTARSAMATLGLVTSSAVLV